MPRVFDFHTHILPGMDDGSRNVQESLAMIEELARQGASGIAATPHFYAHHATPEQFFFNRQAAWEQLRPYLSADTPEIRLGAEVQYFEGIHRCSGLEQFCIEGTQLLLVEMPFSSWTTRMVSTILELHSREDMTVLLAHIERYLPFRNKKMLQKLREEGVLMQVNAGFFLEKSWTAMRMLRKDRIDFLGTDTHNMSSRNPNLAQALETIGRKKGSPLLEKMIQREEMVLHEAESNFDWLRRRGVSADLSGIF